MTFMKKKTSAAAVGGLLALFGISQTELARAELSGAGNSLRSALSATGLVAQTESGEISTAPATESEAPRAPEQILADAQATLDRMEAGADNISLQLRRAREEKDVVKTLCLDDKLNQMNVAARSASDRVASIQAAVESGNTERAQHDDAVLGALAVRANELIAEANQCIGEETGVLGRTELELYVDPSIPTTDTAAPPLPPVISTPPVAASPTS